MVAVVMSQQSFLMSVIYIYTKQEMFMNLAEVKAFDDQCVDSTANITAPKNLTHALPSKSMTRICLLYVTLPTESHSRNGLKIFIEIKF